MGGQPEVGKNGPHIGAKLPVFRISSNKSLRDGNDHYDDGRDYGVESYKVGSGKFPIRFVLLACGLLFIGSSILVRKAIKRDYDPIYLCLAWLGGFTAMVVPTIWWIWH
jgi:hypothetical protein